MATRADVVRQTLHNSIKPEPNTLPAFLLRPETWQVVLWMVDGLGRLMQHAEDPRVRLAGQHVRTAVEFANGDTELVLPVEKDPPIIEVDKRRILLQVQVLQQQLDRLGADADPTERVRLEIKIETLLEIVATNMKGTHA